MAEKEYIERNSVIRHLSDEIEECGDACESFRPMTYGTILGLMGARSFVNTLPAADVVEVVRCKDCKYFVPKHIRMKDGSTREYTEEEKKLPLGVPGNVGINCGSICMLHDYWAENRFSVYVNENDFCSHGERKEADNG